MAKRKRPKALKPLTWHRLRGARRSRSCIGASWFYLDSTNTYRIEQLIGFGELPFVATVYDVSRGRQSHWHPFGRYATLDEAKAACEQHRRTPETNGTARFNEAGDPLPRKFWE